LVIHGPTLAWRKTEGGQVLPRISLKTNRLRPWIAVNKVTEKQQKLGEEVGSVQIEGVVTMVLHGRNKCLGDIQDGRNRDEY